MTRSIDAELISQYRRNGVICIRQLLLPDDVRELNQAFNWSIDHGTGKLANFRRGEAQSFTDLCNPGALPVYQRLLKQGPYAEILSQLWRTEQIWFMYEQVFFKHGGKTERTAWHQDAPYLPVEGEHLAVFWITLNAVSAQSSLEFVAGSHLGKQYNGKDYRGSNDPLYAGSDMEPLPDIETQRERWNIVSWDIEPGDVVVFHPGVLHGGGATEFDAERRTVSLRFFGIAQNVFGDTENSSKALFGQATWQVTDELAITAGLRYSEESKKLESKNFVALASAPGTFTYCEVPPVYTGNANFFDQAGCRANFKRDDESIDYTLNINYALTPESMIYGKVASGFRSGGQNLRGGTADPSTLNDAGVISTFASFKPETVTEYELGFKGDLLDRHLRLNLAAFYSAYDNIQRSTIVPTGGGGTATVVRNAASGTVKGLEAEITLAATDVWQLGLTSGWTDAAYDKFSDINPATQAPLDRSKEAFPGTPEYSYSAWTSYVIPVAVGELTLRADYSWRDEMLPTPTIDDEGITVPAIGLLNARAMWDVNPQLSLALWGTNLTDESYRADGIEFYSGFGYALGSPGEPRMFGVEASYKFGN